MDALKNIFKYDIKNQQAGNLKQVDKRVAFEIYSEPNNFIELMPTENDIWALNNMRQLYVCRDFKLKLNKKQKEGQHVSSSQLTFEPINDTFNVMKAVMGERHQVIIKMVKRLDGELMVRSSAESHFN